MSESEPTLYGTPENNINTDRTTLPLSRLTDAQLAEQWARRAANEKRLDLASALYRIAAQAARMETVSDRVLAARPDLAEEAAHAGLISRTRAEQLLDSTRVVPLIGSTRAEEPRSHVATPCAVCGSLVRWFHGYTGDENTDAVPAGWHHANLQLDDTHPAQPGR